MGGKMFQLIDKGGNNLFCGKLVSLPIKESLIIKKSIHFFDDEEPCFIHRSAVVKRLHGELQAFIDKNMTDEGISWEKVTPEICEILECFKGISLIKLG